GRSRRRRSRARRPAARPGAARVRGRSAARAAAPRVLGRAAGRPDPPPLRARAGGVVSRRDLVVFSLEAWDDVWRRNQYLIDGLLRRDPALRVLFVEPSNDLLHSALSGRGIRRGRGLRTASGYDGRLSLFQPDKVLPRVAGPAADAALRRAARRAMR